MVPIGLKSAQPGATYKELAAAWKAAEDAGFVSGWIYDHLTALGDQTQPSLEAWTLLAALATQTTKLRLGVMVTDNSLRHPAMLAREAVTVDQISGGRLEFGIGAGNPRSEIDYQMYGFHVGGIGERISRLAEACQVLKLLWTEEDACFSGKFYTLDHAKPYIWPVQKPNPPLLIGGKGDRTLRITARYADAWNYVGPFEGFADAVSRLRATCERVGRDFGTLRITAQFFANEGSAQQLRETVHQYEEAGTQELMTTINPPYTVQKIEELGRKLFG